jgi:hypothetical protein
MELASIGGRGMLSTLAIHSSCAEIQNLKSSNTAPSSKTFTDKLLTVAQKEEET